MTADDHDDGQVLPQLLGTACIAPEVAAAVQAGSEQVPALELHAVEAGVAHARIGVLGDDDAVGDVGAAVLGEMARDRQQPQVQLVAGEHDVEDRPARHDLGLVEPVAETAPRVEQLAFRHAGREGQALAAAEDVRDHRKRAVADTLEPEHRGLAARLQLHGDGGHLVVQRHRLADAEDALGSRLGKVLKEATQIAGRPPGCLNAAHACRSLFLRILAHPSTMRSSTQLSKAWHSVSMWVNLPDRPTGRHSPSCCRSTASLSSGTMVSTRL